MRKKATDAGSKMVNIHSSIYSVGFLSCSRSRGPRLRSLSAASSPVSTCQGTTPAPVLTAPWEWCETSCCESSRSPLISRPAAIHAWFWCPAHLHGSSEDHSPRGIYSCADACRLHWGGHREAGGRRSTPKAPRPDARWLRGVDAGVLSRLSRAGMTYQLSKVTARLRASRLPAATLLSLRRFRGLYGRANLHTPWALVILSDCR